jgi:hypothetical protein
LLLVGGAPARIAECSVLWNDIWCELMSFSFGKLAREHGRGEEITAIELNQAEVDAFVERAAEFDIVWCETPEAMILHGELTRRNRLPPAIFAMEVHGLHRAQLLRSVLPRDPWPSIVASSRFRFLAASDVQHRGLVDARVPPDHIDRLDAAAFVYQLMLPDADARLRPQFSDDALAPEAPADAVIIAGTGRRDAATWMEAASLLPDIPFVALGHAGAELPNVTALAPIPLEAFIAAVRRSRVSVVCLRPGDGDGGHTTVCVSQAVGVPVIASAVPGVMDYVERDVSAKLVEPSDPRALATAIRWLWEDSALRARLVRGGLVAEQSRRAISERGLLQAFHRLLA